MSNVPRIKMPSAEEFFRDYMQPRRPVVIEDMFAGSPVRALDTRKKLIEAWKDVQIGLADEYIKTYQEGESKGPATMSVAQYYRYVDENPTTTKMSIEFPAPREVQAFYPIPEVCRAQPGESERFVDQLFVGNRGNHATIHYDKAGLHGFLYQVFGTKRFITFPVSATHKLIPFAQISPWQLQSFTPADRRAFFEYTGAEEVILKTGDCMFVPSMSWHYVDYDEDCVSVSLRFRRPPLVTRIINVLYPDHFLPLMVYKLSDPATPAAAREHALAALETLARKPNPDGKAKVQALRKLTRELYRQLEPNGPAGLYALDREEYFPPLLPQFLDFNHPERAVYT